MLHEIDKNHIWHPFTSLSVKEHILLERAEGAILYTEDGQEIIDAVASWWVNIHGHARKELVEVLAKQAANLEHAIFAGFTHKPAIEITRGLLEVLPQMNRVFFSDNGSTAVEVGLKMGLQYWYNQGIHKNKVISLEGAYHGDTFGSMSMAGKSPFFAPFNDLMFDVLQIPLPTSDDVVSKFEEYVKHEDVAIFVYEPLVQGSAGMRIYDAEILEQLLQIAKKHKVLCLADEVMTGFGRTGKLFASDYMETKPDIMALSKGITGGFMPLGVTVCSKEIESAFETEDITKTFYHGHSYTANALSCAVAVESLKILRSDTCQSDIKRLGNAHRVFAEKMSAHKKVKSVKTLGTILSIEIDTGGDSSYFSNMKKLIYDTGLDNGVLLRPLGNVMYLIPPFVITDEQLATCYEVMELVLEKV